MNKNKKIIFIIAIIIIIVAILIGKVIADNNSYPTVTIKDINGNYKTISSTGTTVDLSINMFKENPGIYCTEHGQTFEAFWKIDDETYVMKYTASDYYEVQDPTLAYILNLSDDYSSIKDSIKFNTKQHLIWHYLKVGNNENDKKALNGGVSCNDYQLSESEDTTWSNAQNYATNLKNFNVKIKDMSIDGNNVVITWTGTADSYNIYTNNSNTAYKSNTNKTSISIPISEFDGDTANVKVEAVKKIYKAGFYRLTSQNTNGRNQTVICIAVANEEGTKTVIDTKSIKLNTDVSLQKYIIGTIEGNVNSNITSTKGRENRYAVDENGNPDITNQEKFNHYGYEISNHTNKESVNTDFYKINKPVEIEVGDSVVYKIEVYNNNNVKSLVTVGDDFGSHGEPKIVEIRTSTADSYDKATKIEDLTKTEYNKDNTAYDGVRYWYDETNKNNKFGFDLEAGATRYIYVTIKYTEYTDRVLRNGAWISATNPANNKTYRTIDADYVKMKDYKVSLEKFVTKVTDNNGTNEEKYNQTSGTYADRSGKRYNSNASKKSGTNRNTYKPENKVKVEPGDIVTYTIRLKNEGTTKVSIGQIEDLFTYYNDKTIKLTQTGTITGNGGGRYETTDNTSNRHLITFSNPTLLNPGQYVDVTIQFKVEITTEATASSHTLINTAAIMTSSLKNKNDIIVPDGDGTDNNRDSDYIKTKTYAVSLEKYISAVNGKTIINKNYDFNGDGVVDNNDVSLMQKYLGKVGILDVEKERIEKNGDIDNSGTINTTDVLRLQLLIKEGHVTREGHAEYIDSDWKKDNVVTVSNGDEVTYTIKVTNDSQDTSVYISAIEDCLPNGVRYGVTEYNGNVYDKKTDNKVIFKGMRINKNKILAPGESASFTVNVTVIEPNISLNILQNTAEITIIKNRNGVVEDTTPNDNMDSDYMQLNYPDDSAVISGFVWNDKALDKTANNYNGQYDSKAENGVKDVNVYLYRDGVKNEIASKQTDENGYYCFRDEDINSEEINSYERYIKGPKVSATIDRWAGAGVYYSYYVVFEYDGITYTSTPDGATCVSVTDSTAYKTNSNAKENNGPVKETRQAFNNRFSKVNNTGASKLDGTKKTSISYTTNNEGGYIPQSNHVYNSKTMAMQSSTDLIELSNSTTLEEQIKYVNLGLRGKDIFDLELTSDVYSTKVSVNGQSGEYNYNTNKVTVRKEDIKIEDNILVEDTANVASEQREGSVSEVKQSIRKTDLDVKEVNNRVFGANKYTDTRLGIEVTYKITVTNASQTDGTATKVVNYYDSRYNFEKAYSGNIEMTIDNGMVAKGDSGSGFESVIITTPGTNLTQSQTMDIYVVYTLNAPTTALEALVKGDTDKIATYNMAEIYEYTTKCGTGQTEYTRGLIDKDSAPGSANKEKVRTKDTINRNTATENGNPTTVQYYFGKISNSYVDLSKLKYEDDTYATPTLYFASSDNNRTIEGTVFEDKTKYYGDRIKSGNGIKSEDEPGIDKIRVLLLEETTDKKHYNINYNDKYYNIRFETHSDENGKYTFEGFLPGNYIIRYEYGDINTFLYGNGVNSNIKSYNGEDFQSTNNTGKINNDKNEEIATLNTTSNYWYVYNEQEGVSTGTDDIDRRKEVSQKVAEYNDYQMTVLNNAKAGKTIDECTVKDKNGTDIKAYMISDDTWMKAYTPEMNLTVEETVQDGNTTKQNDRFREEYKVTNMNFGIAENPVTIIDLQKHVSSFTITDSAGDNTIASLTKQEDGTWKPTGDVQPIEKEGRKGYDVSIEEEKLQGAKLEVTFDITANMTVEKDFRNGEGIKATIKALTDFIDNDLSYNEGLGDNGRYWKVDKFETGTKSTVEGANQYATIVTATGDNAILKLKEDGTATVTITLEKVLSASDVTIGDIIASSINTYEYDNTVEIMGIDYTNTKIGNTEIYLKDRIRTPGTNDPTTNNMIIIAGKQHDSATSETIVIHPPTGENNSIIYYIVAVISLGVLATGIVLIKKYAIKK